MPRINQYASRYASADFLREIRIRMVSLGMRYDQDLAEATGIPSSTIALKLKAPDTLTIAQLRKIVAAIAPDPSVALAFLGYSTKQIKGAMEPNDKDPI